MRRPLFTVGTSLFLTVLFASLVGFNACVVFSVFFFLISLGSLVLLKSDCRKSCSMVLFTVSVGFGLFCVKTLLVVRPAVSLDGQTVQLEGRLVEQPQKESEKYRYLIETSHIELGGAPQKLKILLTVNGGVESAGIDDILSGKAVLYAASGTSRPGYAAKGIFLTGYFAEPPQVTQSPSRSLYSYAIAARNFTRSTINRFLPGEEGALACGLLIGETGGISEQTAEQFRISGLSHMLAVSGQQLAILCQLLLGLFALLKLHRRVAALVTVLPVLCFMALTGFSASVVRSGIMCIIYLIGIAIQRQSDPLTSLGAAVLFMVLLNPFAALDTGLQLSAAATLGIIVTGNRFFQKWRAPEYAGSLPRKLLKIALDVLAQTLSATLFTLPITIAVFGKISLISPLTNLIAAIPVTLLLPITAFGVLFSLAGLLFLAYPLMMLGGVCVQFLLLMTELGARIPFAVLPASKHYILVWVSVCLLLVGASLLIYRQKIPVRRLALLCCILLFAGTLSHSVFHSGVTTIQVYDLDAGFSVAVLGKRQSAVIGAGSSKYQGFQIQKSLSQQGQKQIGLLILPNLTEQYSGGAPILAKQADCMLLPQTGKRVYSLKKSAKNASVYDYLPCEMKLWEDLGASVLNTGKGSFIRLAVKNTIVLISTPGADASMLTDENAKADLLISPFSLPKSVGSLDIRTAVVSADSKNAEQALNRLQNLGVTAYATRGTGSILIQTRGQHDLTLSRESS